MSNRQAYTGYAPIDTGSRITVAANTLTITGLLASETAYLTKDFGAGNFSADFEHSLSFKCTGTGLFVYLWGVANSLASIGTWTTTRHLAICYYNGSGGPLMLQEGNGSAFAFTSGAVNLSLNVRYWLRIVRDESVGTYGSLYAYIYSDAGMSELVEKITLSLTEKANMQYLFAFSGNGGGAATACHSMVISNLTLEEYPYTLANCISKTRSLLAETTASFWTDVQLTYYINQAIRDIARKSGCIQHIDTAVTVASTRLVAFTGYKCHAVEYIPASGTRKSLIKIDPLELGHNTLDGTAPQFWYEDGMNIGIEPIPDAIYNLALYISDYPTDMTLNPDIPQILPAFQPLIVIYAAAMALYQDRKHQEASYLMSIYNNELDFTTKNILANVPDGYDNLRFK
jgi:hypothetical protein